MKSFLGSVQFYEKFIPNLASITGPLCSLTKKATPWKWEDEEQAATEQLKNVLSLDQVLVHFDPNKTLEMTSTSTGRKMVKTRTWCAQSKFSAFKSNPWMPTFSVKSLKRIL